MSDAAYNDDMEREERKLEQQSRRERDKDQNRVHIELSDRKEDDGQFKELDWFLSRSQVCLCWTIRWVRPKLM